MAGNDPLTVAVIDDDDDVRTAMARLLRSYGHRVNVFASAEAFEEAAEVLVVDCAVVDIRLPGLSGLELCERLSRWPQPVPVVLITGDSDRLSGEPGSILGTPSVTKPFDAVELMAAITSAIASASAPRESRAH
jgi:FixJ family two-component response regulator